MNKLSKMELERLIDKPRAFRNTSICKGVIRRTMVLLGSEAPTTFEIPQHYKRLIHNRKYRKNEPLF